ncbi:MFS transporter [Pediococcus siamensis]|uniref:MFS transporter n=1 Tax=Pediococcus siamensis TaxID=381829 RepID=UPI0039A1FDF4
MLLSGRIATNIADSLFYMAILWFFKEEFNSPFIVALIFAIDSGIDMVSFSLGPLIDRLSIKKLLVTSTAIQIVISFLACGMLLKIFLNPFGITVLLGLYLISTIISAFIYPSEYKLLPILVKKTELLKYNGLFQLSYRTLDVFLDGLTTAVIALFKVNLSLIFSGLIFAFALTCYQLIKIDATAKLVLEEAAYFSGNYLKDLQIGWTTLRQESNILNLILPLAVTNLFYGIFSVGLPYFAQTYLSQSPIGYGGLLMSSSIGSILGTFLIQKFAFGRNHMRTFIVKCFWLAGVFRCLVPAVASVNVLLIFLFSVLSAMGISMMNTNFEALVQTSFSSAVLGRVQTINDSLISVMIPIGSLLSSWVIKAWGSESTQYIYGIALILSGLYYMLFVKRDT